MANAAFRHDLASTSVGFRAGLSNVFRRCVKRIIRFRAPSKLSVHAGSTSAPKQRSRPVSLIEEENYVARQVQEIYCKLFMTPLPHSIANSEQRLVFAPLRRRFVANLLPKPFAARQFARIIL